MRHLAPASGSAAALGSETSARPAPPAINIFFFQKSHPIRAFSRRSGRQAVRAEKQKNALWVTLSVAAVAPSVAAECAAETSFKSQRRAFTHRRSACLLHSRQPLGTAAEARAAASRPCVAAGGAGGRVRALATSLACAPCRARAPAMADAGFAAAVARSRRPGARSAATCWATLVAPMSTSRARSPSSAANTPSASPEVLIIEIGAPSTRPGRKSRKSMMMIELFPAPNQALQ
jgi:hypothetical protein